MPKYLFTSAYTAAGMELVKDHGVARSVKNVEELAARVGGKVDAVYYSFDDGPRTYVIADLPDWDAAMAIAVGVSSGGVLDHGKSRVLPLLTPQDMDRASETQRTWPTFADPTVSVEEVPSGPRPIEGVGTATAAFVGEYIEEVPSGSKPIEGVGTATVGFLGEGEISQAE
jgi:uncharacterized protein with GYD domain